MKRLLLLTSAFVLILAAVGVASPAATSSQRGRASAVREANRLLAAYVPPQGAVRLKAVPKGDRLPGGGASGIFGTSVKRHRLWLVHLPTKAFVPFFFRRLSRWHAISYGTSHGAGRSVLSTSVTYAKVGFGGRATGRVLNLVAIKSHRAGWSLLRADVVLVWHLSPAEREDLPAGVREIDIRGPHGKASVTGRDQVRTIVRWFDHFQLYERPFTVPSCGVGEQQSLTFTFRARYGQVTKAVVPEDSGACSAASYTISGRPQTPLIAGKVDRRVQKLLGVKLLR